MKWNKEPKEAGDYVFYDSRTRALTIMKDFLRVEGKDFIFLVAEKKERVILNYNKPTYQYYGPIPKPEIGERRNRMERRVGE